MSEEVARKHTKWEAVKTHVQRHQVVYAFGAGVLATGVTLVVLRRYVNFSGSFNGLVQNIVSGKNNTVITILERRGHPGNLTLCNETGEVFASQARAADVMEINRGNLVSHLNGRVPHVGGYTFTRIGEAV